MLYSKKGIKIFFIFSIWNFSTAISFGQNNSSHHYYAPAQLNDGLQTASLFQANLDSIKIMELTDSISSGYFPNIHSLLIAHNNKLVYEKYWPGKDQNWGSDLGVINHGRDSLHDVRSISKSVVSACIGIAISQKKIKSVDEKIFSFFPEFAALSTGEKSSITIKNLLTMSSGLEWDENISYADPKNSEIRMDNSPDPIQYVLSRPIAVKPGTVWNYNGGGTEVLAAIIKKVTGKDVAQFAKEYLFEPLGIKYFYWARFDSIDNHPGLPAGASGLRLCSRDLLKFGLLYSNDGKWNGQQIIPANWVQESFSSQIQREQPNWTYGYQFWVLVDTLQGTPVRVVGAVGNGDQRILFDKAHDLIIVTTAGNYNKHFDKRDSWAMLGDYILPALMKK